MVDWAGGNPGSAKANAVILSAWNEHDEGHWICPSLKDGTAKLEAIKAGLSMKHDDEESTVEESTQKEPLLYLYDARSELAAAGTNATDKYELGQLLAAVSGLANRDTPQFFYLWGTSDEKWLRHLQQPGKFTCMQCCRV